MSRSVGVQPLPHASMPAPRNRWFAPSVALVALDRYGADGVCNAAEIRAEVGAGEIALILDGTIVYTPRRVDARHV